MLLKKYQFFLLLILLLMTITGCGGQVSSTNYSSPTDNNNNNNNNNNNSSPGAVSLAWEAPTTYIDGTTLSDLAGYKIYYGTSSNSYTNVIDVGNATSYSLNNLPRGTYYITVTAYDAAGNESAFSNEVNKII